jgi:hypothetical protein
LYLPTSQGRHAAEDVLPEYLLAVPFGQLVQDNAPPVLYVPLEQVLQDDEPS